MGTLRRCSGQALESVSALFRLRRIAEKRFLTNFLEEIGAAEVFEFFEEVGDDIHRGHAQKGLAALGVGWIWAEGDGWSFTEVDSDEQGLASDFLSSFFPSPCGSGSLTSEILLYW